MSIGRFAPLPLVLRRLTVLRVSEVTPRMRRVTVGGPELGEFTRDGITLPAFTSQAFDDHVKIVLAPGGSIADALPEQRENGIEWLPSDVRVTRDYTPVHVDLDVGEVSFDFVVHTECGEGGGTDGRGPAEEWAAGAKPGDDLWIVGPKSSTLIPDDVDWVLLVADETGLPAVERFLLNRPMDVPAVVVLTVADEAALHELPLGPRDSLKTVIAEPGDPRALVDAVAELPVPQGTGYVWGAAESRALLPIRRLVTRDWKTPKSHANITGYWHRAQAPAAAPAGTAPARPAAGQLLPVLPQVVHSPVSWFAVRAAIRTGLLARVEQRAATLDELSTDLGILASRLDPLVRLLTAADVLTAHDDVVSLGPGGELIVGDEHVAELFDGLWADQLMLLAEFDDHLPADEPAWRRTHGQSFHTHVESDAEAYDELVEQAARLAFLLPALAEVPVLAGRGPVTVTGPGAEVVGNALSSAGRRVTAVGTDWAHADPEAPVLAALALESRDDAETVDLLSEIRSVAATLVLVEATSIDALGPRALEQALVRVATTGTRPRSLADLELLASASGWKVDDSSPLGWGVQAIVLTPTERR